MIDIIERTREMFKGYLPEVKYVFFNTGLELEATKRHVQETAEKYGVKIETIRPKISIVAAAHKYGQPFLSKKMSVLIGDLQNKQVPLSVINEYIDADDHVQKFEELLRLYPKSKRLLRAMLCCDKNGNPVKPSQHSFNSSAYLVEYLFDNPAPFNISAKCCDYCKKQPAHQVEKEYEMKITGERECEGGARAEVQTGSETGCFYYEANGKYRFRPIYYVTDADKAWYKEHYGIRYSDAYEVYGLTRTGCCGCPISYKAVEDLERIRPYEPNVVKAAYNIFGASYEYRKQYNDYKAMRRAEAKKNRGQISFDDV